MLCLDLNYLPKAMCQKLGFQAMAILGGIITFKYGFMEGSKVTGGHAFKGAIWTSVYSLFSFPPDCHEASSSALPQAPCQYVLSHDKYKAMGPSTMDERL